MFLSLWIMIYDCTAVTLKYIYFTIYRHWLNAHGISNPVDILSQNYYRHATIHLSCCFKNVSQLIVNGRKSSWANISISWFFILLAYVAWGELPLWGQLFLFSISAGWASDENHPYVDTHRGSRYVRKLSSVRVKLFFGFLFILLAISRNGAC